MTPRRATSLRPGQFKHLIRVASVTGRLPERDVMLLWLTHTTGIRVTELALLEVADVLYPSGAIKPEVYLRADITKGCRLAVLVVSGVVQYRNYRKGRPEAAYEVTEKGTRQLWNDGPKMFASHNRPKAQVYKPE